VAETSIEWTATVKADGSTVPGYTFNPWSGCTKVSAGCAHCYAEVNYSVKMRGVKWGPKGNRVVKAESGWREPLKWDREAKAAGERRRVFCASLADVFEDWAGPMVDAGGEPLMTDGSVFRPEGELFPDAENRGWRPLTMDGVRQRLFNLITDTEHLDWLLLTKRPENVEPLMRRLKGWALVNAWDEWECYPDNLHNVWLGASVENQAAADQRIPHLLKVPAAVRFLSCEPLLGPVDLTRIPVPSYPGVKFDSLLKQGKGAWGTGANIGWVIVGGESGAGARPFDLAWARSIHDQCKAAGVAFFMKQMGSNPVNNGKRFGPHDRDEGYFPRCWHCGHHDFGPCSDGTLLCNGCDAPWDRLRDKKGGEPAEWAVDLRVREFPR
jgi:protein gp37